MVILGYFYFGQDQNLADESAVLHATDNATSWILDNGYRNVVVEVANECNNDGYDQPVIRADPRQEAIVVYAVDAPDTATASAHAARAFSSGAVASAAPSRAVAGSSTRSTRTPRRCRPKRAGCDSP